MENPTKAEQKSLSPSTIINSIFKKTMESIVACSLSLQFLLQLWLEYACYVLGSGGSIRGVQGTHPLSLFFFHFHAVF